MFDSAIRLRILKIIGAEGGSRSRRVLVRSLNSFCCVVLVIFVLGCVLDTLHCMFRIRWD